MALSGVCSSVCSRHLSFRSRKEPFFEPCGRRRASLTPAGRRTTQTGQIPSIPVSSTSSKSPVSCERATGDQLKTPLSEQRLATWYLVPCTWYLRPGWKRTKLSPSTDLTDPGALNKQQLSVNAAALLCLQIVVGRLDSCAKQSVWT